MIGHKLFPETIYSRHHIYLAKSITPEFLIPQIYKNTTKVYVIVKILLHKVFPYNFVSIAPARHYVKSARFETI
jgi:hypothetical protein